MTHYQRLEAAMDRGIFTQPDKPELLVLHPPAGSIPAWLCSGAALLVEPDRTRYDQLRQFGCSVSAVAPAGGQAFSSSLIFLPRERALAEALVAEAERCTLAGGSIILSGDRADGVDRITKMISANAELQENYAKAHGRVLFWRASGKFQEWQAQPRLIAEGFHTFPGNFSADGADPGSRLLLETIFNQTKPAIEGRGVDLGSGWGWLSAKLLEKFDDKITHIDLVEADHHAIEMSKQNLSNRRAGFHWADALIWQPEHRCDFVVSNPPFHSSRRAEPELGRSFIRSAAAMLRPGGVFWLVANRQLPYEDALNEAFTKFEQIEQRQGYKIIRASGPKPKTARAKYR